MFSGVGNKTRRELGELIDLRVLSANGAYGRVSLRAELAPTVSGDRKSVV